MHLLSWEVLDGPGDNLKIRLERDANVIDYAILSHRWGKAEDEVSFDDMLNGRQESKRGYKKLVGCCLQAQKDGLHFAWIDTCCINKASSAELSEAITSMFLYYAQSKVCYVYMDDVAIDSSTQGEYLRSSSFSRSAWFTRGWTLQELIAPRLVKFFDGSWSFLGLKTNESLSLVIESITGIDLTVLNIPATTRLVSVSKRMSWAARRKTTRIEDVAYSLMGIFGVYMSPLYGEGHHAFVRLQEAIMRTSNDHTIFAWTSPPVVPLTHGLELVSTMLALSPDQFEFSAAFRSLAHSAHNKAFSSNTIKLDYAITNAGLSIRLPLLRIPEVDGLYAAFLACTEDDDQAPSAILLRTTPETPLGYFWRTNSNEGPIERSERRWFPSSGREAIDSDEIYVLPRFSSVSGDNIEPPWNRLEIATTECENAVTTSTRAERHSFVINTTVLRSLNHVVDPSFRELAFLRQAHQMISTNQADQLVRKIKTRPRLPTTLPFPRNRQFHGRATTIHELRDGFFTSDGDLKNQGGGSTSCAISGMGGIGKTQVALAFTYYCLENDLFNAVIWINCGSSQSIHGSLQRTASELKLAEEGSSPETLFRKIMRWLSDMDNDANILSGAPSVKWLLVLDNVDNASSISQFYPSISDGPGGVLVTSRDKAASYELANTNITLDALTIQESLELFRHLTRTEGDYTALSQLFDGHPLTIAMGAREMVRRQWSPKKLLDVVIRYNAKEGTPHGRLFPWDRAGRISNIWSTGLDQLDALSLGVIQVISFLDPDFIKVSMLIPTRTVALKEFPRDELDLSDGISGLLQHSLVSKSSTRDGVHVHRRVQNTVRERMNSNDYQGALSTAVTLVYSAWIDTNVHEQEGLPDRKIRDMLLPHVVRLGDFETEMVDTEENIYTKAEFTKLLSYAEKHTRGKETLVE